MLKTFFFVSKQLDILHSWSTIKALQIVLILIVMSILTGNAYRYISLTLLIACFALVCYIITDQFIRLKTKDENSPSPASSSNWCIFQKSSKHLGLLLNKTLGYRVSHKKDVSTNGIRCSLYFESPLKSFLKVLQMQRRNTCSSIIVYFCQPEVVNISFTYTV